MKALLLSLALVALQPMAATPAPATPLAEKCPIEHLHLSVFNIPLGPYCPGPIDEVCLRACKAQYFNSMMALRIDVLDTYTAAVERYAAADSVCFDDWILCLQGTNTNDVYYIATCNDTYNNCKDEAKCSLATFRKQLEAFAAEREAHFAAVFLACASMCCEN